MVFLMVLLLASVVIVLLLCIQSLFSMNYYMDSQLTVLEAGYEGLQLGVVMSSSFFSLVALFVLFDLELVLLFPAIFSFYKNWAMLYLLFIIMIVLGTLMMEWFWYGLTWQV